ncbi:MAG: isoaspartyl peptidase/L-asparaginase family protein [Flavobacteriales bacterium]
MNDNNLYSIALHGGAGTLLRAAMTPEKEAAYRAALNDALLAGMAVLETGGNALEAVVETVAALESCELFNAGKGAVFTRDGGHELDATLMEGSERRAGAVCGLRRIEHPIRLCRLIMDSPYVMLNGDGAEAFAAEHGIPKVENSFFSTPFRYQQLQDARETGEVTLDHNEKTNKHKFGTVGAVARDRHGNLAAATSTGGMTNKPYRRIGDSALIGAGTWADNATCAVSATGHGEFFIRTSVASRIASRMEYGGADLKTAAEHMVLHELKAIGGEGGIISVDRDGNLCLPFNSEGMYRAWSEHEGKVHTAIFSDDARAHGGH